MSDKKYQIFISSTYEDLKVVREKVLKQILRLHHFPVGMEMFNAGDDEQWAVIKRTIDQIDYYVLIIGHRYGSEADDGISYTEKEFDYAKSIGVPILSFIRDRNAPTTQAERDDHLTGKKEKLDKFIAKVKVGRMCDFWKDDDELAVKVTTALVMAFESKPRIGWVRSDQAVSPKVSEELARLSSENRELTVELETYRRKSQNRKPKFEIMFQPTDSEGFVFKEIPFKPKIFPKIEKIPSHLAPYIYNNDIHEYNNLLPSEELVSKYNKDLELYTRKTYGSIDFKIIIKNIGNCSGAEIKIDIKIPEGIIVITKNSFDNEIEPTIELPENPLEKAKKLYRNDNSSLYGTGREDSALDIHEALSLNMPFSLASTIHQKSWIDINDSKIAIEIKKIIHTREEVFGDLVFVPLYAGKFIFEATAICEEMEVPEHIQIEVLVS